LPIISKTKDKSKKLLTFLNNLDNKIKNYCIENQLVAKNTYYKKILRTDSQDPIYKNGYIRLKILKDDNSTLILKNKTECTLSDIKYHDNVTCVIDLFAIWVTNESYGVYIKPIIISAKEKISKISLLREDSDDDNIIDTDENKEEETTEQVLQYKEEEEEEQVLQNKEQVLQNKEQVLQNKEQVLQNKESIVHTNSNNTTINTTINTTVKKSEDDYLFDNDSEDIDHLTITSLAV
jgi:hypothetical protein